MGKVFGILVFVLGLWVTLEVFNHGTSGAFDGALVRLGWVEADAPAGRAIGRRAGDAVAEAQAAAAARRERLLAE
jgi:hypothetical protein